MRAGVSSMFFRIGVYEPERVAAAREGDGLQLPGNQLALIRAGAEADH
jgi:hippurate hydrolase